MRRPSLEVVAVGGVAVGIVAFFALFELAAALLLPASWYLGGLACVWLTVGLAAGAGGRGRRRLPVGVGVGVVTSLVA